jgi:hypothetical protein
MSLNVLGASHSRAPMNANGGGGERAESGMGGVGAFIIPLQPSSILSCSIQFI